MHDIFGKDLPLLEIKENKLYIDGEELDHTNIISYELKGEYQHTECSIKFYVRT